MNETLAIIVTYNRKKLLGECLDALITSTVKCDILIVDNFSTDGTRELVEEYLNRQNTHLNVDDSDVRIIYYNTGENLGGSGGYNIGVKEACKYDYKYFWLMDDDCIVMNDALFKFYDADKKLQGKWGFLSSKVLWIDGEICKTNIQRKKVARFINDFDSELVNVDYASFVSLFIKKEDVLKRGLPIKDFFIWSDDLEYTRRLSLSCGKGYLVNGSIVTHKCKENTGIDITKDTKDRIDRYKYIYRNDIYTFKREGILGILFLFFRFLYHFEKILFESNDKMYKIKIMIKGYIEGFSFNPEVEFVK